MRQLSLGDLFWIFFLILALQPFIQRRFLEMARYRLIRRLEKTRNSRVIVLIHRQEVLGFLGIPIFRMITIEDAEEVIRAIQMTDPDMPIDLILHTPGGLVLASLQIARALKRHRGKVTVFIPHYAMSGGTLIALAADEIVMSPHAVLGPVDPQLMEYPAPSLLKLLEKKPLSSIEDRTLIFADIAEKAIRQLRIALEDLLSENYPSETCQRVATFLTEGHFTHDYPITIEKARELGLKVREDLPQEILELLSLYPQPIRRSPSVEYSPLPRYRSPS
jgi:ClpP class serine protease